MRRRGCMCSCCMGTIVACGGRLVDVELVIVLDRVVGMVFAAVVDVVSVDCGVTAAGLLADTGGGAY